MKKLILLALFAAAAWYGWKNREALMHPVPSDQAVIVNAADRALLRVRLTVDGQTMVRDAIEPGASTTFPFHIAHDSDFQMDWQWRGREGRGVWRGGLVTANSPPSSSTLTVSADGSVTETSATIAAPAR